MALIVRTTSNPNYISNRFISPFGMDLRNAVENIFNRSALPVPEGFAWSESDFPKVDMSDDAKSITLSAELPGVEIEDINIEVSDDSIMISGEKNHEVEEEDPETGWYQRERSYGFFRRELPLAASIDRDSVEAKFKNGVLTVKLVKNGNKNKSQAIPITAA
jgi:HSP20 family protein